MPALEMKTDDPADVARVDDPARPLAPGEARLAVRRFALTANNVTYAVFGRAMRYWDFFPAVEAGRGRVPVWGFAEVTESAAEGLAVGTRVYGYLPMASGLVVRVARLKPGGFVDAAPHRADLPAAYNRFEIAAPADADAEGRVALLKPLFITGFLLDAWIAAERAFGAGRVVVSSASSKTALSMAACLAGRGIERVGLTSARSRGFVEATGLWDRVATYDEIETLGASPAAYVDFAGDAAVTRRVHETIGAGLLRSVVVGGAHWNAPRLAERPPGPAPTFFFAPDHAGRLGAAWGAETFAAKVDAALGAFVETSRGFLDVVPVRGLDGARTAWARLLANETAPREGLVVDLEGAS